MSVFAALADALFGDPNLAVDGALTPAGGGEPVPCRVVRRQPTEIRDFGGLRVSSATASFDLRRAEVPQIAEGDVLTVEGLGYIVQGAPQIDDLRLVWTIDTRPVEG